MFPLFCFALDPVPNTTFVFCSEYCSRTSQAGIQLPVPDLVCVFSSIFPSFFCVVPTAGQGLRQPGNLLPLQKLPDLEFQDIFFPIQDIRFDKFILPAAGQGLRQSGILLPIRKNHSCNLHLANYPDRLPAALLGMGKFPRYRCVVGVLCACTASHPLWHPDCGARHIHADAPHWHSRKRPSADSIADIFQAFVSVPSMSPGIHHLVSMSRARLAAMHLVVTLFWIP